MEEERKIKQDLARSLSDQRTIQQLSSSGDAAKAKRDQIRERKGSEGKGWKGEGQTGSEIGHGVRISVLRPRLLFKSLP